jgi:hypothetical protein
MREREFLFSIFMINGNNISLAVEEFSYKNSFNLKLALYLDMSIDGYCEIVECCLQLVDKHSFP